MNLQIQEKSEHYVRISVYHGKMGATAMAALSVIVLWMLTTITRASSGSLPLWLGCGGILLGALRLLRHDWTRSKSPHLPVLLRGLSRRMRLWMVAAEMSPLALAVAVLLCPAQMIRVIAAWMNHIRCQQGPEAMARLKAAMTMAMTATKTETKTDATAPAGTLSRRNQLDRRRDYRQLHRDTSESDIDDIHIDTDIDSSGRGWARIGFPMALLMIALPLVGSSFYAGYRTSEALHAKQDLHRVEQQNTYTWFKILDVKDAWTFHCQFIDGGDPFWLKFAHDGSDGKLGYDPGMIVEYLKYGTTTDGLTVAASDLGTKIHRNPLTAKFIDYRSTP